MPSGGTRRCTSRPASGTSSAAFREADVRVEERFHVQRYVGMPLETRGVVAQWDPRDGSLTTWNATQVVHFVQQGLATALGLPPHKIRVIAPDVGGGFGTKANGYPEDLLIPVAAIVCRAAGEVDGGPARAHGGLGARAGPGARHRDRGAAGRDHARRARPDLGGPRRLQHLGHRPALQHRRAPPRAAPRSPTSPSSAGASSPTRRRTRPTAEPAAPRRSSPWTGSSTAWPASSPWTPPSCGGGTTSPQPTCPTSWTSPIATAIRSSTTAATSAASSRPRSTAVGYGALPPRAGRAARARHLPRHRDLGLRRGHGHRPLRGSDGEDGRLRAGGRGHGRREPGAGTRDLASPRSPPTRSASRSTGSPSWAATPRRSRSGSAPSPAGARSTPGARSTRRPRPCGRSSRPRRQPCSRPRPPTSRSATAWPRCGARRVRRSRSRA